MASFSYKPLDIHNYEIRILIIEKERIRSPAEPDLQGTLEHASLIRHMDPYIALSYCWGDTNYPKRIFITPDEPIACQEVAITSNLHSALWALWKRQPRQENGIKRLRVWVDSICINQGDIQERSEQVRRMQGIYSKAESVVAWVGSLPNRVLSPATAEYPSNIHVLGRQINNPESEPSTSRPKPLRSGRGRFATRNSIPYSPPLGEEWEAMKSFFEEYWTRVWIIQEITVASTVRILYGNLDFSWDDVAAVLSMLISSSKEQNNQSSRTSLGASHLLKFREHFTDPDKTTGLF
jgi:hypothetical protein